MAIASTKTLLSLDRYAAMMGINPAHFNQAVDGRYMPMTKGSCGNLWYQYSWWAADRVAREDLALAIADAEADITTQLGWWPAPTWVVEEVLQFERHYRRDVYRRGGLDNRGGLVATKARYGKIIAPGQRAVSLVATATVGGGTLIFSDADGDDYNETATVAVPTTVTDIHELKVYFNGHSGEPEWEVRPARTRTLSGGTFTATFWAWQLLDPDQWYLGVYDNTNDNIVGGIDLTSGDYVSSVDVYREYNDTTARSAQLFWEPRPRTAPILASCPSCGGTGCIACAYTTQDGCLHVRDPATGMVVPQAATYDATEEAWSQEAFDVCRDPDLVKVWYYCGALAQDYISDRTGDPLPRYWAEAIKWLATARLERPFCGCANPTSEFVKLQADLAISTPNQSKAFTPSDLSNPFGTKMGEVKAWKRVESARGRLVPVYLA